MADAITGLLPDTCDIYDPPNPNTATRDANGEVVMTFPGSWSKLNGATPVACRVESSRGGHESPGPVGPQATSYNSIALVRDTAVNPTSRIKIISSVDPILVGQVFDVID